MKWRCLSLVVCLAVVPAPARADGMSEAKNYFKAGAAAYAAGEYLAAIQALDAAYRLTPLPAIAFSLAQAERRQHFVSREPAYLLRAIQLFRVYLKQVPSGGRRGDATDALAQLEPLALGLAHTSPGESATASSSLDSAKTRIMVSSEAPGATISLDGAAAVASPLITEASTGGHTVRVAADGFFPSDRRVVAIAGELVPIEVDLRERPAQVIVEPSAEADLYVDDSYAGKVVKGARIELSSGSHRFSFVRKGHRLESVEVLLHRGETRRLRVDLHWTGQRVAAIVLFAVSGATLVGGVGLGALAAHRENDAKRILDRTSRGSISPAELEEYESTVDQRNRLRAAAVASLAVSAGSFVTGVVLHELDEPNVREGLLRSRVDRPKPSARVEAGLLPSSHGIDLSARFSF